jgi:hypothetical protein
MPFAIESLSNFIRCNGESVKSEINSYRLRVRLNIPQYSGFRVSTYSSNPTIYYISTYIYSYLTFNGIGDPNVIVHDNTLIDGTSDNISP